MNVTFNHKPFKDRLPKLVATINQQFAESAKLEKEIERNFKAIGWE